MKARRVHDPRTAPIFMLPICAILMGISWHVFVSIILRKQMSIQRNNSYILGCLVVTKSAVQ